MENELVNATLAGEPRETDAAAGGVTRKAASVCGPRHKGRVIFSVNLSSGLGRRIGWKEPRRA